MGIDVSLYTEDEVTPERLAEAQVYLRGRLERLADDPILKRRSTGRIMLWSWQRYYVPGYERGHWPTIHHEIRCLRAALPECRIYYGADVDDEGDEVTDERLEEIWQHYLGPDGDAYHQHKKDRD